jgi:hypothetical protein
MIGQISMTVRSIQILVLRCIDNCTDRRTSAIEPCCHNAMEKAKTERMKKMEELTFLKERFNDHLKMSREHEVKLQGLAVAEEMIEVMKQMEKILNNGCKN